jgi:D-psicose/D-tagatose/L-ribulose 3-epimerase
MNIEEKNFYKSTKLAGNRLMHYHLCENDRGIPGTGLVNWDEIFRALADINYQGHAAMESFVDCTDNMNTWVWRQLAPSGDTLLKEGAAFLRQMQAKYGLLSSQPPKLAVKAISANNKIEKKRNEINVR